MLVLVQYNETSNDNFMKILVTGGNGFIATNFIKLALHEKYSVTSLDNLSYAGSQDNHKIFENNDLYNFLEEDIKSKNIYEIIKKEKYDAQPQAYKNNPAFGDESHHSNAKNK